MEPLPLSGVRIADFTRVHAGPSATLWLSLWGADVIKLESRSAIDMLRTDFARGHVKMGADLDSSNSFFALNCGKRSCTLNLATPEGLELARGVIELCDAVVENYSAGVMERFGLDFPSLRQAKPDLIMLSLSGPGQTGPERGDLAFAYTVQAYAGLCSISGYPGGPPVQVGPMWADVVTGEMAAFALLAALYHRDLTGEGQHVDLAMNETMLAMMPEALLDCTLNGRLQAPTGNDDDFRAPHGAYRCLGDDRWVAIAVADEGQWRSFCRLLGNPEWAANPQYRDMGSRWEHRRELDAEVAACTATEDAEALVARLQAAGISAGLSASPEDLFRDPHLRERGFFVPLTHPRLGEGELARIPFRVDGRFVGDYAPAPILGQDNRHVLHELLGLGEDELEALTKRRVIY